jgi:multidrug efflux pump subunit AcrA (membrane-fusion protein)
MKRILGASIIAILTVAVIALPATSGEAADLDCLIEPYVVVSLTTRAEGILETVTVDRGDLVTQGQIVATLDSAVEKATVAVNSARAELSNKRLADLELQRASAELALRTIQSPINGVVVQRLLSPGELVKQAPILKIAQIDPLHVEVFVPVSLLGKIAVGMRALVTPEPPANTPREARVSVVDRVVDAASGTFGVRLDLPNPGYVLPAGLKCKVRLPGEPAR